MPLLSDILQWTKSLPAWQQDATRRLFQKPDGLSKEDFDELYGLLKAAHGLPNPEELVPAPLSESHLPAGLGQGDTIVLKAVRDLKHVNCIAPKQVLQIEPTGMTVIYGGNGSGKSGYARVMKRACRARDEKEQVLPDANTPSSKERIPEAIFDIEVNGTAQEVRWSSDCDPPVELASIAVFDSHCARIYVTAEQEVAYLPYGLDIVEALGNLVLPKLSLRLDQEISEISTDSRHLDHLRGDTEVGQLIDGLSHRTKPERVETLATLSEDEINQAEDLKRTLNEANPVAKAKEFRSSAERLKGLVIRVGACVARADDEAMDKLKAAVSEANAAGEAERAAARVLHSGESLLPGTGEPVWKALFQAARKFSAEVAYPDAPFPNTMESALCVLCQQPLDDAAGRLRRFEEYIQNDVAKTAAAKRSQLASVAKVIERADLTIGTDEAMVSELDELDATVLPMLRTLEENLEERRAKMIAAIPESKWDDVPSIDGSPLKALRDLTARQYKNARNYEKASDEKTIAELREKLNNLTARKSLLLIQDQVVALIERLKKRQALDACKKDLNTRPISLKTRELASSAVTTALKENLDGEFAAFGIGHIKTKLKSRNAKGKILHQLLLDIPTIAKVTEILSEGEQRAIALGSFMAELGLASHSAAIVFDDPVSSLDHRRRKTVAKRLAFEAVSRQVLVLTHDIVFLHQLQNECSRLGQTPGVRFLEKIGKHAGAVSEGLPWDHKNYGERIHCLEKAQKKFERLPWPAEPHEELAREMIQQYSFLRATIERVVQDFVLNSTVRRFEDYIQVKNLDKVVGLEEAEVREIQRLYQRCHDIVEAHDPVSAIDGPPPTADEFGKDILALRAVIQVIKDRRKT